ncbi:MAG TPA: hypothetical protein PLV03_08430, partial [Clostridiales bacterium]|nr:hypothetical protein [Clostridiales bacterium]
MVENSKLYMRHNGWGFVQNGCSLTSGISLEVGGRQIKWESDKMRTENGIDPVEGAYTNYTGSMETSALLLTLTARYYTEAGFITLQMKIENRSAMPVVLGKCTLFSGEIALDGGNPAVLKQSGWVLENDVRALREGENVFSKTFSLLFSRETRKSIPLCFLTFDRVTTAGE